MAKPQLTAEQQLRVDELKRMSPQEWDAVCKGCGICCLCKTTICFTPTIKQTFFMDVCCNYLNLGTKKCTIYDKRLKVQAGKCRKVNLNLILNSDLLPSSCGYVEYIYGPSPVAVNVDFNQIRPIGNMDRNNLEEILPHIIKESCHWNQK